jgi:Na+/pantothenate symporter
VEEQKRQGLSFLQTVVLVAVGVVLVLLAFSVLHFLAGLLWGLLKLAFIVVVVAGLLWFFLLRKHR